MTESKHRRRSYKLTREACEILASASIRLKRHPSDLVSEAIIEHLSHEIEEMPYKKEGHL